MVVLVVLPGIAVMTLGVAVPVLEVKMLILMTEFWTRRINYCFLVDDLKVL